MVEATYMGTASRDLYIQTDVNRFAGDMIQNNGYQTRLNPDFGAITYGRSTGLANSNLAAFSISKHFTKGWTAHAIYTYGKSLDYTSSNDNDNGNGGAENIYDAAHVSAQYGRSNYDSRQRFSGDLVWDIPGIGNGIAHTVTSGWSLAPVIILQSGQPFSVITSAPYNPGGLVQGDFNADGYDYDAPNTPTFGNHIHASRSKFLKGVFSASAFGDPANGIPYPTYGHEGNLGRNTYDGPGFAVVNMSAQRTFKVPMLGEAGSFELRGEFFNLFNRVNLVNPNNDLYGSNFGQSENQSTTRQIQITAHIRF
jgi:hypothetical protein